jgi:NAD(P)-dependent dehydrogenase (short-subunit alcohol dehydrogenase family)
VSPRRVCVLTGAGGRLGTAFCREYAADYDIVAVYRKRPPQVPTQRQWRIDPLQPEAALDPNPVFAIQADLTAEREIDRVVELALARFERVDLLVNAAVHAVWAPMIDSPKLMQSVAEHLQTNVVVPLRLSVALARAYWRDRDKDNRAANRNIVNVSSTAGVKIYRGLHQGLYSASKAALNFLSRHMADEFSSMGVRVNALAPNSFPRLVRTSKVASAIVKLDSGQMNGSVLLLDRDGERLT